MLNNSPYYWGVVRSMVISFGKLFSDVTIERTDLQKKKVQVINVPIAYGPKEKWLRHIQENPDLSKQVKMDLPRMSFEVTNYRYDPERKIGPNPNYLRDTQSRKISTPIPYNFDFTLYIATRTQDDMLNIIEQILPFFAPALFVNIKVIEDPLTMINVPITLNNIQSDDNWDDTFTESRLIVSTLTFTAKGYLFGPVVTPKVIKRSIADVTQNTTLNDPNSSVYTAEVDPFAETNSPSDDHTVKEFWENW
jgi:hypothetical protein